jgi:LysM repeat protein
MSQPIAGSSYIVQQGDTLASIARQAYSDESLWQEIYAANRQVIGDNPSLIHPGTKLYIPANPQRARVYLTTQSCAVAVASLNIRDRPTAESNIAASYPQGTVLNFIEVMESETVNGNSYWGRSTQGHYFWMGGTNRPQG